MAQPHGHEIHGSYQVLHCSEETDLIKCESNLLKIEVLCPCGGRLLYVEY